MICIECPEAVYAKSRCKAHYMKDYASKHRAAVAAKSKRWRERHPDSAREQNKKLSDSRTRSGYYNAYRLRNLERIRARMRQYQIDNPEPYRHQSSLRRARLAGAEGAYTSKEWTDKAAEYSGLCAYCGDPAAARDHVVPLSRGGSNYINNLVPACVPCNQSKGSKLLEEWGGRRVD